MPHMLMPPREPVTGGEPPPLGTEPTNGTRDWKIAAFSAFVVANWNGKLSGRRDCARAIHPDGSASADNFHINITVKFNKKLFPPVPPI